MYAKEQMAEGKGGISEYKFLSRFFFERSLSGFQVDDSLKLIDQLLVFICRSEVEIFYNERGWERGEEEWEREVERLRG